MSERAVAVRSHRVWAEMQSLGPVIETAADKARADSKTNTGVERLRVLLAFTGKRRAGADPELVQISPLDSIGSLFGQIQSELNSYIESSDIGRLSSAEAYADSVLDSLFHIVTPVPPEEMGPVIEALEAYRKSFRTGLSDASAAIGAVNSESERVRARLTEALAEQSVIATRYSELESRQEEALRALHSEFSAAQAKRDIAFQETRLELKRNLDSIVNDYNERLTDQNAEFTIQRSRLVDEYELRLKSLGIEYSDKAKEILAKI